MRQQLLLGTAQWGMDYGVTNHAGRLSDPTLENLVGTARNLGIRGLDSAPVYGDAHTRIREFASDFAVQTKVSAARRNGLEILNQLAACRLSLGQDSLWSVLVHDWSELDGEEREHVAEILREERRSGRIERIGVSIYAEEEIVSILLQFPDLNVVQVPTSVLDQRLAGSHEILTLRNSGVEIQARSIFLQGLLLDEMAFLYKNVDLDCFARNIDSIGIPPLELCVNYIRSQAWVDEVIVGATSSAELKEISEAFSSALIIQNWADWASLDVELLDPRRWPRD